MGRKRRKPSFVFFIGKNISKSDSVRTPVSGVANTYIDFYEKKSGKFHRRRKLDSTGHAYKDLDMPDYVEKQQHVHKYTAEGKRLKGENPSKKELKEMKKASKKRRFW